jgi:hypothetical protein
VVEDGGSHSLRQDRVGSGLSRAQNMVIFQLGGADGKQRVYGMDTVYLRPAPSTKWTRDLVDSAHLRTDQEGKYV